ncbi:hypothetical protein JANAI62_28840 [Jannaschia pagri]|uniref:Uncharacterized protein n=1 Tax=Jannaschia pagri TaxID=2829797 RepID=A0ABQ4NPC3_9RHOB|nr:hypothetical protein JANAI61_28840 [Jannaschia sp. AI_61]GIT96261.1 hypothetical protein JANAI62_28840 [Jannaschia sp. AI_62]
MMDGFDQTLAKLTEYQRERVQFAAMKRDLQRRKRARMRLRLALWVAGRRPMGRRRDQRPIQLA